MSTKKLQVFVSRNTKIAIDGIASRLDITISQATELVLNSEKSANSILKIIDEMPSMDGSIDLGYLNERGIIWI